MIKTKLDVGVIETPMVAPHLEVFTFSKARLGITEDVIKQNPDILNSGSFTFVVDGNGHGYNLSGIKIRDVLRLADGTRTRFDIVECLKDRYASGTVNAILANLAYRDILISARHDLDTQQAMFWSENGISPCYYEAFSQNLKVAVHTLNDQPQQRQALLQAFADQGVSVTTSMDQADVIAVLVDDYLQSDLQAFNQARLKDKTRWIPIRLCGSEMHYGPIFMPDTDGACLHCITNNMRNNSEMRGFLAHHVQDALVTKHRCSVPPLLQANSTMVTVNVIKDLILETEIQNHRDSHAMRSLNFTIHYDHVQKLKDHLVSYNVMGGEITRHYVNKRPQCLSCGDPRLTDPARPPVVPKIFSTDEDAKSVFTSGGMKATNAKDTLKKYDHLVSPITGIVTSVERSSPPDDEWMHVYWSGSNLAIVNRSLQALTNSIRSKSAGKGRSDEQARVSALCEALERYSGVFNGDEIRRVARFSDFEPGEALHPNDLMLFSDRQYGMRAEIAQKQYRFYRLPDEDFDENAQVEWAPVWSLTRQKHVWMMVYQLYFSYDPFYNTSHEGVQLNRNFANPDSNGAAAGNTVAEAFVQGFMELVERDAYAIWWYNRLRYPEVDIASFNDPYLDEAVKRYAEKYNRKLWVLDITNDFGIPVFVAISQRFDKEKQDICISAGAHFDPHIALLRAVCELNQYISAVLKSTDDPDSYTYFDRECNDWWQNATLDTDPYLLPDPAAAKITRADYPIVQRDLNEEVQACIDAVHDKGLDIMVLDQTRADVKLPVVKVIVPGMRHFWARFAPGRLYDVPVKMGKLSKPLREDELNPTPVFI